MHWSLLKFRFTANYCKPSFVHGVLISQRIYQALIRGVLYSQEDHPHECREDKTLANKRRFTVNVIWAYPLNDTLILLSSRYSPMSQLHTIFVSQLCKIQEKLVTSWSGSENVSSIKWQISNNRLCNGSIYLWQILLTEPDFKLESITARKALTVRKQLKQLNLIRNKVKNVYFLKE